MIGTHESMKVLRDEIARYAKASDAKVLILGENGSGKELVARALHDQSVRKDCPYEVVNCGAIPEHLIESELFGHEKGAFTGATSRKPGRFEIVKDGTLFLDEIGELPQAMQAKLLRVLQTGTFRTVGGTQDQQAVCRVLAATNKSLKKESEKGTFRRDLYHRLAGLILRVPPLRVRVSDIPALLSRFVPAKKFTDGALRILQTYDWPGNVRELENVAERLEVLCDDETIQDADVRRVLDLDDDFESMEPARPDPMSHIATLLEQILLRQSSGSFTPVDPTRPVAEIAKAAQETSDDVELEAQAQAPEPVKLIEEESTTPEALMPIAQPTPPDIGVPLPPPVVEVTQPSIPEVVDEQPEPKSEPEPEPVVTVAEPEPVTAPVVHTTPAPIVEDFRPGCLVYRADGSWGTFVEGDEEDVVVRVGKVEDIWSRSEIRRPARNSRNVVDTLRAS